MTYDPCIRRSIWWNFKGENPSKITLANNEQALIPLLNKIKMQNGVKISRLNILKQSISNISELLCMIYFSLKF